MAAPPPKPSAILKAQAHNHTFTVSEQEHTQPPILYAQALYDFPANEPDELPFEEQDTILIPPLSKDIAVQSGWLYGENNGVWGWFPNSYVRILTAQEAVEIASCDLRNAGRFKAVQGSVKPYMVESFDSLCTNYSQCESKVLSIDSLVEEQDEDVEEDAGENSEDDVPLSRRPSNSAKLKYAELVAKAMAAPPVPSTVVTGADDSNPPTPTTPTASSKKNSWLIGNSRKSSISSTHSFSLRKKFSNTNTAVTHSPAASPNTSAETVVGDAAPAIVVCHPESSVPNPSDHDIHALIDVANSSPIANKRKSSQFKRVSADHATAAPAKPETPRPLSHPSKPSTQPPPKSIISMTSHPAGPKKLWIDTIGGSDAADKLNISAEERKRQEVIHEIIHTERDYVSDLEIMIHVYMKKIKEAKGMRPKDVSVVFSNLEAILPLNMELLKRLEERQAMHKNGVVEQIGDIFVKVTDYLKMYTMYCSNHPYALMKLQTVRQTRSTAKFLDALSFLPECRNLDLPTFLLKPIQRICKYPLLIRETIRHTHPSHPDFPHLTLALSKIETVVTIVNEGARQAENVQKMLDLQTRLVVKLNLVMPSRVLKKNGPIDYINKKADRKRCELYLFSDILVLAKPVGGGGGDAGAAAMEKLKLMAMVPFDMILINCPAGGGAVSGNAKKDALLKDLHLIEVVHVNTAKFTLALESVTAKALWVKALQEATQEWLTSKTRFPASPSKLVSPAIVARNSVSNDEKPVAQVTVSSAPIQPAAKSPESPTRASPIQFQIDGVPVNSVSQLMHDPTGTTIKRPNRNESNPPPSSNSPRRQVKVPVPIGVIANEAAKSLEMLKHVEPKPLAKSTKSKSIDSLSGSNDDISLSQIAAARKKPVNAVAVESPSELSSSAAIVSVKLAESDSDEDMPLQKIISKLPLSEGTKIMKSSSREFNSQHSLKLKSSTDTLSGATKSAAASPQQSMGSITSLHSEVVSSSRLALNNFIVQDHSKPHQSSQHYLNQHPDTVGMAHKPPPHSSSLTDTSCTSPSSAIEFKIASSLPVFKSASKDSLAAVSPPVIMNTSTSSLPVCSTEAKYSPAEEETTASAASLPTTRLASDSNESITPKLNPEERPANMSLHSLISKSRDSISGLFRSEPSLVEQTIPPPVPCLTKKPVSSSKSSLSETRPLSMNLKVEEPIQAVASPSPVLATPSAPLEPAPKPSPLIESTNYPTQNVPQTIESLRKSRATTPIPREPDTKSTQNVPQTIETLRAARATTPLPKPQSQEPPHLLRSPRSHTDNPTSPTRNASKPAPPQAPTSPSKLSNPIIDLTPAPPHIPGSTHSRAYSAVDRTVAHEVQQQYEHLSVRARRELLLKSAMLGTEQGVGGGVARAMSFRAEAMGEDVQAFLVKGEEGWRRSVGVETKTGGEKRGTGNVHGSGATMHEEVGEEDGEGRQVEQLKMNKPVKKLVFENVVQQTGRHCKDFIYIIRVYHNSGTYSVIHQTFEDFVDFHMSLVAQFPEDAGVQSVLAGSGVPATRIIPELPPQMMFVSEAVAKLRINQLQAYSKSVLALPVRISRSPYVMKFFRLDGKSARSMLATNPNEKTKENQAGGENIPISVGICNDGGSIPKRHELVTLKAKEERPDKVSLSDAVWNNCSLSKEPLLQPIVLCQLGRLYNKDKLIEFLVDRDLFGEGGQLVAGHIANLKDVLDLSLTPNPAYKESAKETLGDMYETLKASQWLCPITLKEFGGRGNTQFGAMNPCGCVLAREAVEKVGDGSTECLVCGKESAGVWPINPSNKTELDRMKVVVETLKIARAEHAAAKKAAKMAKKRKAGDAEDVESAKSKAKKQAASGSSSARANISIPLPSDLAAKTSSAALAMGQSDAIKSLYAKDKDKPKGNYLTMGTFNRYTA
ncbi:Myosin 10A, isoform D [Podochytrium sp. JEL0797]|nr:Myosin 10A, isoform D [Podochytrium sp. JEL0797]